MAQITQEYLRKGYMRMFSRMSQESRTAAIEALQLIHDMRCAEELQGKPEPPPLVEADSA
jgi:hypothetical protein